MYQFAADGTLVLDGGIYLHVRPKTHFAQYVDHLNYYQSEQ